MKIKVRCDCGKTLVASDQLAGKKTKCPACGAVIRLPRLDEVSEQPASFLVTETGLNLTTDSQEVSVAPAEQMPNPFNFTFAEQVPAVSRDGESHGDSDASNTTKGRRGRELSTIPELWAAFITMVRTEWATLRQPLHDIESPTDPHRAGEPVPDLRGAAIRIVAGIGLVAWLVTLWSPPSLAVPVHYLGLGLAVGGVAFEVLANFPRLKPFRKAIVTVAVIGAWWVWPNFDVYDEIWTSRDDIIFTDSRTRSGRFYHRRMLFKPGTDENGKKSLLRDSASGPMAGTPPKPHGHWAHAMWEPYHHVDLWYWYGDEITQGEWELRNK